MARIDKILTWADYADEPRGTPGSLWHPRESSYTEYLTRLWELFHDDSILPAKPDTLTPILAFVNCGRWMVSCDCGGASAPIEPGEDFVCPVCEEWHSVTWPADRAAVEDDLLQRAGFRLQAPLRNWRP